MGNEVFKHNENMKSLLIDYINSYLTADSTVLDIGCGTKEIANFLKCLKVTTLDVWKPFEPDIWCDLATVPRLPCEDNTYNVVLLVDVIEHLPKDKGFKILKESKRAASNYVIILTPLWWDVNDECMKDPSSPYYKNEYDKHLSLWDSNDLIGFEQITSIQQLNNYFLGVWKKDGTT